MTVPRRTIQRCTGCGVVDPGGVSSLRMFLMLVTLGQMALGHFGFGLGEPEFIAVVTTTTASVFGFGFIVGNYLFPKR